MHSAHRDLESKFRRLHDEMNAANKTNKMLNEQLQKKTDEVTDLKTQAAENETTMA